MLYISLKNNTEAESVFLFGNFGSLKQEMIFLSRFAGFLELQGNQLLIMGQNMITLSQMTIVIFLLHY